MISKALAFLNEPFPQTDENAVIIRISVLFGGAIFFILAVFQPFDFSTAEGNVVYYYAFIFSLITTAVILSYEFFLKYVLKIRRDQEGWTLWKWFLSNMLLACCIATANYFFATYEYGLSHAWPRYFSSIKTTIAIGILPILALGAIIQANATRRNEALATRMNAVPLPAKPSGVVERQIRLPILHSDKYLEINPLNVICAEAMQNYVQIYSWDGSDVSRKMIRNTISNIEEVLEETPIRRSHRSFLVNTTKIEEVTGNAQGLKLSLQPSPGFTVPVSRKYIPVFKKMP
ncbi:MAG TPA: LytTR family DNA-binding domain-containing protein [Saprospiraceae bacterium]|nr:LytTR family DNA-binding domain-containing protein [Saprospiraceae bacterium]